MASSVQRPGYPRDRLQIGIVHLGIGAFARAHLALATELAIEAGASDGESPDLRWGICGVSLQRPATRDALAPQAGLYTLAERDADAQGQPRQNLRLIGCLCELLVAPEDPGRVIERIASPAVHIVSLSITEKGYCRKQGRGQSRETGGDGLDLLHPDIQADLKNPARPRSALGYLLRGLALRQARGLPGLSLLSLDNLPHNGDSLFGLLLQLAAEVDDQLAAWIAAHCPCPNSMVDRIVPATTEADRKGIALSLGVDDASPVVAEPYFEWVIEDRFAGPRPRWEAAGVRWVADAQPWECLKLRMVNGAHSAIAYLGLLAGWETVDQALAQPAFAHYLQALLLEEVAPTVPALQDAEAARACCARLLRRFANPALAHRTLQIAADGSQKIPQRWLLTLRERDLQGLPSPLLLLALAAWLQHLQGLDERGRHFDIKDPLAHALAAHALALDRAGEASASKDLHPAVGDLANELLRTCHWLAFKPVFAALAESADSPALQQSLAAAWSNLRRGGVLQCLQTARAPPQST